MKLYGIYVGTILVYTENKENIKDVHICMTYVLFILMKINIIFKIIKTFKNFYSIIIL